MTSRQFVIAIVIVMTCCITFQSSAQVGDSTPQSRGWPDLIVRDMQIFESQLRDGSTVKDSTSLLSNNSAKELVSFSPAEVEGFTFTGAGDTLMSKGIPVTVSKTGTRFFGRAGNNPVFKLGVEHDGQYLFTLFAPLDHKDSDSRTDSIFLNFALKGRDRYGAIQGGAKISVEIIDDTPEATATYCPLYESKLANNRSLTVNGQLRQKGGAIFEYGSDGAGHIVSTDKLFAKIGFDGEPITLTSRNQVIQTKVISFPGEQHTDYIGYAGAAQVFKFHIDTGTGKYRYTQFQPLDHPIGNSQKPIVLFFGISVHDRDNDEVPVFVNIDVYDEKHKPESKVAATTSDGSERIDGQLDSQNIIP